MGYDPTGLTVSQRVANGAALLDSAKPDWWRNINLDTLNQSSCMQCVLGQTYGSYFEGCSQLEPAEESTLNWRKYHAFSGVDDAEMALDTAEWKRVVNERFDLEAHRQDMPDACTQGPATVVKVNDLDTFVEVLKRHFEKAVATGEAGTSAGDLTISGLTFNFLNDLGVL